MTGRQIDPITIRQNELHRGRRRMIRSHKEHKDRKKETDSDLCALCITELLTFNLAKFSEDFSRGRVGP
jgi:hypothetical protein